MAKSSTLKKLKNNVRITSEQCARAEDTVNKTVMYVDQWARKELLALISNKTNSPVCIPIGKTGYLIGKFKIKHTNNFWVAQDIFSGDKSVFASKIAAVIYALCDYRGYQKLANEILKHNTDVIKISEDLTVYSHLKELAKLKHDTWRIDHYTIMEDSTRYKLEDVKIQLEKSLRIAKYFKLQ